MDKCRLQDLYKSNVCSRGDEVLTFSIAWLLTATLFQQKLTKYKLKVSDLFCCHPPGDTQAVLASHHVSLSIVFGYKTLKCHQLLLNMKDD